MQTQKCTKCGQETLPTDAGTYVSKEHKLTICPDCNMDLQAILQDFRRLLYADALAVYADLDEGFDIILFEKMKELLARYDSQLSKASPTYTVSTVYKIYQGLQDIQEERGDKDPNIRTNTLRNSFLAYEDTGEEVRLYDIRIGDNEDMECLIDSGNEKVWVSVGDFDDIITYAGDFE